MEIKVTGDPKEIAALVLELQGRQCDFTTEESIELSRATQQFISDLLMDE